MPASRPASTTACSTGRPRAMIFSSPGDGAPVSSVYASEASTAARSMRFAASPLASSVVPDKVANPTAFILPSVSVPVLSVRMTLVVPKVSAARRLRTNPPFRRMRSMPSARTTVTAAGRPSGTEATARATAIKSASEKGRPRRIASRMIRSRMMVATPMMRRAMLLMSRASGVSGSVPVRILAAIPPISVAPPTATTMPRPAPPTTSVPA